MQKIQPYFLADIIREIERGIPVLETQTDNKMGNDFSTLLIERSLRLDKTFKISSLLNYFKGLTSKLFCFFSLLLATIGGCSVQQFFFSAQGSQVNFFWAFALFFIPNIFMFFIWLFLFFRPVSLQFSFLGRMSLYCLTYFEKYRHSSESKHKHFWRIFKCFFRYSFTGKIGKYQLSCLTHLLWFSYFCGATLMLLLMLGTHQVDFIWQSNLLSTSQLQVLTQGLATIPHLFGIPVPSPVQISESHLGVQSVINGDDLRFVWSMLLISSFVLYGILPRFFLFLLMRFCLKRQQKNYYIDESHFYYVQLRQKLQPNSIHLGVIDTDNEKVIDLVLPAHQTYAQCLPSDFFPVAIELSEQAMHIALIHLKTQHIKVGLNNLCDNTHLQVFLRSIDKIKTSDIVLYVALKQLPDRGLKRLFITLNSFSTKTFHLLLIDDGCLSAEKGALRLSQWYQLALNTNIDLDNIMQLRSQND